MSKKTDKEPPARKAVRLRLEEAGATMLAMPGGHGPAKYRSNLPDVVRDSTEAYGYGQTQVRPPIPDAASITRMDEALKWVGFIPDNRYVLRCIVNARCLVAPLSRHQTPEKPKYIITWRMLATQIGADWRAVQRWHCEALDIIAAALAARS
jgi:hypothetical protein